MSIGGRGWFWQVRDFPEGGVRVQPVGFALAARVTFFLLRQEESNQRRRRPWSTPGVARCLALLGLGGGCGTRPLFRPNLRCSASHKGPGKASRHHLRGQNWRMSVFCCCLNDVSTGRFSLARRQRRATEALAEKGRGLSEGRSPEFRSALSDAQHREEVLLGCPRQRRVAQGTGEAGADAGLPFLCVLSFGEAKESAARLKRENQRLN